MKRKISIPTFVGQNQKATIIIDRFGMRVEDKSDEVKYENNDYFYRNFIKNCIDYDDWNHSWYIDIHAAMRRGTKERKECRDIMLDKIRQLEEEIQMLKDGIQVLSRTK